MNEPHESDIPTSLFPLGTVYATPAALDLLRACGVDPSVLIFRHHTGDWGTLSDHDLYENRLALEQGFRLMSVYPVGDKQKVWIITEADRAATTLLLPDDY